MERSGWVADIGLEIHIQLATRSRLFSGASTRYGEPPNALVDAYSLGLPGVLPVLNRRAVELALRLALALGARVNPRSRFARKHYFYPDLPKGYQITQHEEPLAVGGHVPLRVDGHERSIPLVRLHLEEDAGKSVHDAAAGVSRVDFNRAGVPLVELVSQPELRSPQEAAAFMKALAGIAVAVGATHGNLEEGNLRCDANVSVRPAGSPELGRRVEVKNLNSFRFVRRALEHEIERQIRARGQLAQETRLWDDAAGLTRVMRSKEGTDDYRYLPEPDLGALVVDAEWLTRVRQSLPELPHQQARRFVAEHRLEPDEAWLLAADAGRAAYFDNAAEAAGDARLAAKWVSGELAGALRKLGLELSESPVGPEALGELLRLLASGRISGKMAKGCLAAMLERGVSAADWVARHGSQISDPAAIRQAAQQVLDRHPAQVAAYLDGKERLLGFFIGLVMKATGGKANPERVAEALRARLEEERACRSR